MPLQTDPLNERVKEKVRKRVKDTRKKIVIIYFYDKFSCDAKFGFLVNISCFRVINISIYVCFRYQFDRFCTCNCMHYRTELSNCKIKEKNKQNRHTRISRTVHNNNKKD